ncbi:hypothetical protein F2Q69_00047172 [Brassica cretica]|uniref:Uncharacterized protein n=1 Tax=Brassica cretica TaxID=69181 RepID=A0A8S9PWA9_BRACR|nr:hypothetical protein F2Q69_00047172 [Brassica cretica]
MVDTGHQNELAAELQRMQQQIQQNIQAQQDAALLAAQQQQEQPEKAAPIGQRNLLHNLPTTRSAISPPPCLRQDFEIKPALIDLSSVLSATESPLPSPGTQIGDLTLANGGGDLAFPGGSFVLHSILGSSLGFQIFSNMSLLTAFKAVTNLFSKFTDRGHPWAGDQHSAYFP